MKKIISFLATHCIAIAIGFAIGIYTLPILIAPESPASSEIKKIASSAQYTGEFTRNLKGSDLLHWGEGVVTVGAQFITLTGELAPGPDYKLYLSPNFVESEDEFTQFKSTMVRVGDVKTFENFVVEVPDNINPDNYNTVIIWCEAFGEFITAAKYR